MKELLNKMPRWALVLAIILLSAPAGYALRDHVVTDEEQSADIAGLITVTENLKVVVEYNRELADNNRLALAKQQEFQMRMAQILGKLEGKLDK